jgi:hypothetical protein
VACSLPLVLIMDEIDVLQDDVLSGSYSAIEVPPKGGLGGEPPCLRREPWRGQSLSACGRISIVMRIINNNSHGRKYLLKGHIVTLPAIRSGIVISDV